MAEDAKDWVGRDGDHGNSERVETVKFSDASGLAGAGETKLVTVGGNAAAAPRLAEAGRPAVRAPREAAHPSSADLNNVACGR
ncbi:MAG TPA: hypothetical protein VFU43_13065 [Streptosporangiaceae bacterium]|nr:hypothetical protein [Streptosporangiaceae bacterium]